MPIATKLDMKKDLNPLYAPPTYPVLVEVPQLRYLMIDGVVPKEVPGPAPIKGFEVAVGASLAWPTPRSSSRDFVVMPLEGLFWADGTEDAPPVGASPM